MVKYEPEIIQKFATKLYSRANSIVGTWTLGLGLVFLILGVLVGASVKDASAFKDAALIPTGALVGLVVGLIVGYTIGSSRAFVLKLQAQQALCMVQIEANARQIRAASSSQLNV